MLTTRRGFFGALAALVGVAATGRVLAAHPTTGGIYPMILGDSTTGTFRGINRATFSFRRNRQVSCPEFYNQFYDNERTVPRGPLDT